MKKKKEIKSRNRKIEIFISKSKFAKKSERNFCNEIIKKIRIKFHCNHAHTHIKTKGEKDGIERSINFDLPFSSFSPVSSQSKRDSKLLVIIPNPLCTSNREDLLVVWNPDIPWRSV